MREFDGDPATEVAALYRRTWPRLIGLLISIGGSRADAEEIAEDAYVKLLDRWDKISRYDDPDAWVRAVAVRALVSRLRRQKVATRALAKLTSRASEVPGPDGDAVDVGAALARITPSQRAVAVLYYVTDLSIEQVADELQLPRGTVKSRLARARQALAPLLEVQEEVPGHA